MTDRSIILSVLLTAAGCTAVANANDPGAKGSEALSARRVGPEIPEALAVPPGHKLALAADASGFQIYVCAAGADASGTPAFAWTLKAPEAKLLDDQGRQIGTHFAGPTWKGLDGSTVVGTRLQSHNPSPDSIPWLLLQAASTTGHGVMSKITYIQRLDTSGGLAPASGCDRDHLDRTRNVTYSAKYYFYQPATPNTRAH